MGMAARKAHWAKQPLLMDFGPGPAWASTVPFQLGFPSLTHWEVMEGSCGGEESSSLKSQDLGSSPASSPSWTGPCSCLPLRGTAAVPSGALASTTLSLQGPGSAVTQLQGSESSASYLFMWTALLGAPGLSPSGSATAL